MLRGRDAEDRETLENQSYFVPYFLTYF